ncbi:MAG TPA: T9SS type A sorting domain-containing protein [Bacteroidales bacterium]|nr:T9SS type A sorting domain-containing protein [Bacteroidales bacterium]
MQHIILSFFLVVAICGSGSALTPSSSENNNLLSQVRISNPFPNPASVSATFGYFLPPGVNEARIVIRNLTGHIQVIMPLDVAGNRVVLDISKLRNGIYLYTIEVDNQAVVSKRLVVAR